ncbi:MAG TPA: DNA topoisomerase VI subunit B, partial [Acidobacteriota bacterium]|nr:DNA topoisomerase VI subunit B [Acidobacteriota bacterium]
AGLAYVNRPEDQAKPQQPAVPKAEGEHEDEDSELARVIRYANRVPLLYQQSACSTFKAVLSTTWKNYGITQSRGALPGGPMVIFVHMASVWVPFTSESKEAIADYDEIQKEITLALRECGRRLGLFLRRRERAAGEYRRRNIFELYIEEVAEACNRLKGGKLKTEKLKAQLQRIANSRTGGMKTDEALGKTGGGPEGLPHSIIVTPEGIEGEVAAALESDKAATLEVTAVAGAPQTELLGEVTPIRKQGKGKTDANPVKQGKRVKTAKSKAAQLALFSGEASRGKKPAAQTAKARKSHKPRGKK